jgi:hypothetical protein
LLATTQCIKTSISSSPAWDADLSTSQTLNTYLKPQ